MQFLNCALDPKDPSQGALLLQTHVHRGGAPRIIHAHGGYRASTGLIPSLFQSAAKLAFSGLTTRRRHDEDM